MTDIDSTDTEDESTKVIGYLKKMFKSPETLSKYWDKISDSNKEGKMQKAHFNKLIQTVLKKMDDPSFLKVNEDNLLSMLWDSVRNGGMEEEIGEVVLSKWIFGVSAVVVTVSNKKKKKKKKRKTSVI